VGNVSFNDPQGEYQFNRPYSEKTSEMIDVEVRNQIDQAYKRTKELLTQKRDGLEQLAHKLLEKEILFQADLEEILGKRPFDNPTTYDEFVNGEEHGASKKKKASDKVKDLQHEGVVDHEEVADHHTNLPENRSSKG
jgi:cell division protease FtsH